MNETVRMPVRIDKNLKEKLEKLAEKNNTSLNALAIELFKKALEESNNVNRQNEEKINNEAIALLEDKIDFILQQQQKLKEEIKKELQKEILEDFKIFVNVLAKKIKENNKTFLTIKKPLQFSTVQKFAEANKQPFLQTSDLIAAIDVFAETGALKIYKITEVNSYTNIKAKDIKSQEEITINLLNETHYLAILQIYKQI